MEDHDQSLLKLRFPSQADRLKLVRSAVSEAAKRCGCTAEVARDIVIAVDEACQNVIRHAYGGASDGEIILEIRHTGDEIVVFLRDFAKATEVAKVKPRELDDLRPGGLGTHFIGEVMDEVEFMPSPPDGGNLLRMVKRIA
ncbi:MAG: ATP-binding protein [Alphaproteobacteria bacterium]|jgi:sigma-B regulation protein RsbU (phosphoserine phosphatase)|nr:ATP-binding protein [Alphaproteobacteria bacterium]MCZ6607189.1 ATP-binding protein [Alphaproteobacteria bacterium]